MRAEARMPACPARDAATEPIANCTRCPVCGSEECLVLEELGTYCATMTAASLAARKEPAPAKA